jgi:hypothetical protein
MELNKIKQRLELALRLVEKPPTLEEVLEQVSRHGVLRGPVDWVFPGWMLYVEYATQKIADMFQLTEEERRQLFHFRDTVKRLLLEAWMQAKKKLTALYKAVVEGTYRIERNKLYTPDGVWMYVGTPMYISIHGISAPTCFPDVLKLPRERLELFQLGWRASDESEVGNRPYMETTQPWQVFAWVAVRYGEIYAYINSLKLTRRGMSVAIRTTTRSWSQRWNKNEAISLVKDYLRRGGWAPLLTMWLGDGKVERKKVLHGNYKLVIVAKEPWRLGNSISTKEALIASGKEAFRRLRESAGVYGELLDLLRAHKWISIKLATEDGFRAAYKLKAKKRSIDVLREEYGHNSSETSTVSHTERSKKGAVMVAGVAMYLHLVSNRGGSLFAKRYTRDAREALAIAGRLESAGLRPNVVRSSPKYMVYIATADLLKLAERDETIRRTIALYLAEKVKNGTPRQREIARKLLQRYSLFLSS